MKLEIMKGQESSLIVEDAVDSIVQNGFLADSYSKAFNALSDYIGLSDIIRREASEEKPPSSRNGVLYRSPQNLVAFSGRRGSGKSSTMLSFSKVLSEPGKLEKLCETSRAGSNYTKLKDRHFIVLDPIDPTTLEQNQSILSVVLSRLLFKAEESWNQHISFYGSFQEKESKKTDLLSLARQCLNGIRTIKSKSSVAQELSDLQKVGDSSILKKNLYDFVELFMQFSIMEKKVKTENCMLVLQIDDTDCQISQGYEVMEDIRKYLTIPNVLILMATDTKLLRQVLSQHYISSFRENVTADLIEVRELRHLGEKHLSKLMPPPRVVHLPNIDEVIRDKTDLIDLHYYEDSGKGKKDLLRLGKREGKKPENYDFQSVILRYIYRKTHIVFASHDAYANNIIPTTLRGLAYLLSLRSSMEDVPEIDLTKSPFNADYLAEALQTQFPILERNLNLFEEYFLNDWIQAKLPPDMIRIVEKLSNQVPDQRISFIIEEIVAYYTKRSENRVANTSDYFSNLIYETPSYADLDELLRTILGTKDSMKMVKFQQSEDFYFVFAIRTLLTIKNNKEVLQIKRRTINNFATGENKLIVFDYLKSKTSLPTGLYLDPVSLCGQKLVTEVGNDYIKLGLFSSEESQSFFNSVYFQSNIKKQQFFNFNFTGAVIKWLTPQKEDYEDLDQLRVYQAQELAVLVSANCDVQEVARKSVAREGRKAPYDGEAALSDVVEQGLQLMQCAIVNINQNMFEEYKLEGGESYWKVCRQFRDCLDSFGELVKEKEKTKETAPKEETSVEGAPEKFPLQSYPLLEENLPQIYDSGRISEIKQSLLNYEASLKGFFEAGGFQLEEPCKSLLTNLVRFDFQRDEKNPKDILNRDEFLDLKYRLEKELSMWVQQLSKQSSTESQDDPEKKNKDKET